MAKNQMDKSSKSSSICERMKNSSICAPFRKTHRISHHPQSHNTSGNSPPLQTTHQNPTKPPHDHASWQFIQIETGARKHEKEEVNGNPKHGSSMTKTAGVKINHGDGNDGGAATGSRGNDKISAYITRVRNSMRTPSDLGIQKAATLKITKRDSFNDKISNFLNRAKFHGRTTTNIGDSRTTSFKDQK